MPRPAHNVGRGSSVTGSRTFDFELKLKIDGGGKWEARRGDAAGETLYRERKKESIEIKKNAKTARFHRKRNRRKIYVYGRGAIRMACVTCISITHSTRQSHTGQYRSAE